MTSTKLDDPHVQAGLFAVFLEARQGQKRTQWFLFPPNLDDGRGRFIKRQLLHANHKAKWNTVEKHSYHAVGRKLGLELDQYESTDWVLVPPIVIQLEVDDFAKVWEKGEGNGNVVTPYKALRHVNAQAKKRGYTV